MATLASASSLKTYLGLTGTSEDTRLTLILEGVSGAIERRCNRVFASASYTGERHNGNGLTRLRLNYFPVTKVTRVCVGVDSAIEITNASETSEAKLAYVLVTKTTVTLELIGGANAGSNSLTLASYTTVAALLTAINAVGKGWTATAEDSDAQGRPATDILPTGGNLFALDESVYLDVGAEPESDWLLDDADAGIVYCPGGFPTGTQNIVVDYTAGHSTVPDAIEHACIVWAAAIYNRAKEGGDGLAAEAIGPVHQTWQTVAMPAEVENILVGYTDIVA